MAGTVRDYAILYIGAGKGAAAGGGNVALGGNALLSTAQHKLDGVEHLTADDTTYLDASTTEHGLMPRLSGAAGDVFRGDGSQAPLWVINVLDYGAVEDFATDNAAAFAAAVAAMVPGCTLLFPSVTGLGYKTSATISITQRGCVIAGTGSEYGTRIHMTTANTTLLSVIPAALDGTRNQTNLIRGLVLTGPGGAGAGRGVYASSDVHLENVGIAGFFVGLFWDSVTFYSRAFGCFITNCVTGIVLEGTNNCTVDTCRITGNFGGSGLIGPVTDGIIIATPLVRGLTNRVINSSIEYFTGDGIRWNGGAGGELVGNYFETQQSSSGHAHVRLGESNDTQALWIAGNYFQGDGIAGFDAIKAIKTTGIFLGPNKYGINAGIGVQAGGAGNNPWTVAPQTTDSGSVYPTGSTLLDQQMSNPMTTAGDTIYGGAAGVPTRKAAGTSTQVWHSGAVPSWGSVVEADLGLTDITTANASTSAHGFLKKLDNDLTHFMRGDGAWATVSGLPGGAAAGEILATDDAGVAYWREPFTPLTVSDGSGGFELVFEADGSLIMV